MKKNGLDHYTERVEWLLKFAQREDLAALKGAPLRRLSSEVLQRYRYGNRRLLTAREINELANALLERLNSSAGNRDYRGSGIDYIVMRWPPHTKAGRFEFLKLTMLADLVEENPNIGRCKRSDCSRFFIGPKRQQYCSDPCGNLNRVRAYRTTLSDNKRRAVQARAYLRLLENQGKAAHAKQYRTRLKQESQDVWTVLEEIEKGRK